MRTLLKYCFFCLTLFSLAIVARAQDDDAYTGKVETTYHQDKDQTDLEIRNIPLTADKARTALLNVSVTFDGKKMKDKPDDINIIVSVVNAKGHSYPQINKVVLSSGNSSIGQMILLNLDQRAFTGSDILETLGTVVKLDLFHKIAAAKGAVTFKIAETTFTIAPDYIPKLAEYEKALRP